jgi:hypothetical protein
MRTLTLIILLMTLFGCKENEQQDAASFNYGLITKYIDTIDVGDKWNPPAMCGERDYMDVNIVLLENDGRLSKYLVQIEESWEPTRHIFITVGTKSRNILSTWRKR